MEREKLIFGCMLVDLRKMNDISQWQLSLLTGYNPTNLRKVEKGKTQAGVSLASRLIIASNGNLGDFFQELARKLDLVSNKSNTASNLLQGLNLNVDISQKAYFGLLFAHVRKKLHISQQDIATKTNYHLRNIYEVEHGKQEPGVIVALLLVNALQIDIKQFFERLEELYKHSNP